MDNDIVFLDSENRLSGFAAGMSADEQRDYIEKYNLHVSTWGEYKAIWEV